MEVEGGGCRVWGGWWRVLEEDEKSLGTLPSSCSSSVGWCMGCRVEGLEFRVEGVGCKG